MLRKVDKDYDPTDRSSILCMLEDANRRQELLTGLIYIDTNQESLFDLYNLPDEPLNRLTPDRIRPSRESLDEINTLMF
jgi:2-oxoglutarate ferredoxin oxidoreductase subunit beta